MTVDEMEENEGVKEDGEESKKTWSSMKRKRDEAGLDDSVLYELHLTF